MSYLIYRLQDLFLRLGNVHGFADVATILFGFIFLAFTIWMLIDCLNQQRDYYWIWIIMMTGGLGAFIYFYQFHWNGSLIDSLPFFGFTERRRVKELQSRLHFVDNVGLHQELGELYLRLGKLKEAEASLRKAAERDPKSFEIGVSLGYTLLAQERADEAWEYLRPAYMARPEYNEDELLWQCARCQTARGEYQEARTLYEYLLTRHSYYAAQVEFARLLVKMGDKQKAGELLHEISDDLRNSPRYVQRREGRWGREARRILRELQKSSSTSAPA